MATDYTQPDQTPIIDQDAPVVAVDPARESLVSALQTSFGILRIVMVVLIVLYLASGFFRVNPGQKGLVSRLGELRTHATAAGIQTPVFDPDWYWLLPDPFDTKILVDGQIQSVAITTFMFNHEEAATAKDLSKIVKPTQKLAPGVDGAMLTGDLNLSHGRWEVQYHIEDAAAFVRNVGLSNPSSDRNRPPVELLLARLTETAVVREVAGRTVEEVTRHALDSVRQGVKSRLQDALDELDTGIMVDAVVAYTIEPGAVRPAFLDVVRAMSERERLRREAQEAETRILNQAAGGQYQAILDAITAYGDAQTRKADEQELAGLLANIDAELELAEKLGAGQVAVRLSVAKSRADQINEQLRREYESFRNYRDQYKVQPRITMLSLWVQMRREILSNRQNEIFFVPSGDEIEILINRDPQRQLELEEEAARQKRMGL